MSVEILMNVTPRETRVAVVENGVLQEVIIERARRRGIVGNIYNGKVARVLPGMQAAFVDIGLGKAAFLHASDVTVSSDGDAAGEEQSTQSIETLLREGQKVLVQVIKDPLGSKGARLTTHITIPSRFLVFTPNVFHAGVSLRIENEAERQRLRDILTLFIDNDEPRKGGYIVRTAGEGVDIESLRAEADFLNKIWRSGELRASSAGAAEVVHEDLPLALRTLRDLVDGDVEKIRIDSRSTTRRAVAFAEQFIPEVVGCIEHYPGERPIFDLYSVEDEIQKALARKVHLKSGGYLIMDQTEAMTTIDVNTGAFVGHRNLEETIFKTNLEASQTIARQLRLRNLGGIIIIDFIDMLEEEHKRKVLRSLQKNLERDRVKNHITEVSSLGLVEMTRKRTRESLERVLCEACPTCNGRATLKTAETVCYEIFREIFREARQFDAQKYLVLASQEVVDLLLDEESTSLAELAEFIGKPVNLQVESLYSQEQFDVVMM